MIFAVRDHCVAKTVGSTDKGEAATAKATLGDDEQLVGNGVYWWQSMVQRDCQNPFPVFYGQSLWSPPVVNDQVEHAAADFGFVIVPSAALVVLDPRIRLAD